MKSYKPVYQSQRKKVFKNSEIEHIWAQQTLDEGRNPQGNVFFNGPSLFSYGRHFETARFVAPGVVLVTTRTYSSTTAGHVSAARGAVSHLKRYDVPTFDDPNANATAYITDLTHALDTISRMRSDSKWALEQYARDAKQAAEYVCTFKVRKALKNQIMAIYARCDNPLTPEVIAQIKKRQDAARIAGKAERERKAAQAAARKTELQKDYDAWKAGEIASLSYEAQNLFPVALRVTDDTEGSGKMIQTTKGARVPVIEARKLYHALAASPDVAGMRVGHYTVTGVRGTDLIVGCHVIPLREVARMAVALGFTKAVA